MMKALVGFAGFGGVDIALREAGFNVTGIEIDLEISEVNRLNGGHCLTADLLVVDPSDYAGWTLFHFSPPCPNFSVAKSSRVETEDDLQLARKICQFIKVGRPEIFTLENVWLYRRSLSWLLIWYTLLEEGYSVGGWNLNAADYGVPQSRRRMIVIARRDGRNPTKPWPTHSQKPDMFTRHWRGWYEAIEDLIPDLPETEFAPWQLDRLPDELKTTYLVGHSSTNGGKGGIYDPMTPSFTVTPSSNRGRAFITDSANGKINSNQITTRTDNEPVYTITALEKSALPKAFIVGGQYQTPNNGHLRKVVSLTPRCLARFQDFPDWFALPEDRRLACLGIGNALPVGLYRAVISSLEVKNDE